MLERETQSDTFSWVHEKTLKQKIKGIKAETAKGEKLNCDRHINLHKKKEDKEKTQRIIVWIRKARTFRENSVDIKKYAIRNFGVSR